MGFSQQKQCYLKQLAAGKDKSKKGYIDGEIKELVEAINMLDDYYTTSSCAGRIMLYSVSPKRKKNETAWLFVSHTTITPAQLKSSIMNLGGLPNDVVYFRFEPLILHVVCRNQTAAEKLLQICNSSGLKHSGIISLKNRIILEIIGNDRLDAPIAANGRLVLGDDALVLYINDANKKMERNNIRIKNLVRVFLCPRI